MTTKRISVSLDRSARDRLEKLTKPGETEYAALNRLVQRILESPAADNDINFDEIKELLADIANRPSAVNSGPGEDDSVGGRSAVRQLQEHGFAIQQLSSQVTALMNAVNAAVTNGNRAISMLEKVVR